MREDNELTVLNIRQDTVTIELNRVYGSIAYAYMKYMWAPGMPVHVGALIDNWREKLENGFDVEPKLIHYLPDSGYCLVLTSDYFSQRNFGGLEELLWNLCVDTMKEDILCPALQIHIPEFSDAMSPEEKAQLLLQKNGRQELLIRKIIKQIHVDYEYYHDMGPYMLEMDRRFFCSICCLACTTAFEASNSTCRKCAYSVHNTDKFSPIKTLVPGTAPIEDFYGVILRESYRIAPGGRLRRVDEAFSEFYKSLWETKRDHVVELYGRECFQWNDNPELIYLLKELFDFSIIKEWNMSDNEYNHTTDSEGNDTGRFRIVTRTSKDVNVYDADDFIDIDALIQNITCALEQFYEKTCPNCTHAYEVGTPECEDCWRNSKLVNNYVPRRRPKKEDQTICKHNCIPKSFMICCNKCSYRTECAYKCGHWYNPNTCGQALYISGKEVQSDGKNL